MFVPSQFAVVIRDVEAERVFLAVGGSETHNVEQALGAVVRRVHRDCGTATSTAALFWPNP
jgi:hypothetical protein